MLYSLIIADFFESGNKKNRMQKSQNDGRPHLSLETVQRKEKTHKRRRKVTAGRTAGRPDGRTKRS